MENKVLVKNQTEEKVILKNKSKKVSSSRDNFLIFRNLFTFIYILTLAITLIFTIIYFVKGFTIDDTFGSFVPISLDASDSFIFITKLLMYEFITLLIFCFILVFVYALIVKNIKLKNRLLFILF